MLSVYSDEHKRRNAKTELYGGELVPPFECPERMDYVLGRLIEVGLGDVLGPDDFGMKPILRIHDPDYVNFLQVCWDDWQGAGNKGEAVPTMWPTRGLRQDRVPNNIDGRLGYYALAGETSFSDGTWEAAFISAQVALTAAKKINAGEPSAFALCRPPGHHAAGDLFGGYCFLNNAAIAAQVLLDDGAQRIAILDVDFHHGNGTQDIFYGRDDIMFLSLHGDPMEAFPYFLGHADETGSGTGEGFNVNYPMPPGTDFETWASALDDACQRIAEYAPDVLVVSLGVDTFKDDPISFFKLGSDDFSTYGERISKLGLPTLFVMEGGYAVEEIGINAVNVLTGFEDSN